MGANLNIESQTAKHEKCQAILDMIKYNRNYMLADIRDSGNAILTDLFGKNYYKDRIAFRTKIQNRLLCYYAKEVAKLSSAAYEVALEISKPKQSPIN